MKVGFKKKYLWIILLSVFASFMAAGIFMPANINTGVGMEGYSSVILLIGIGYLLYIIWGIFVLKNDDEPLLQNSNGRSKYLIPVIILGGLIFRIYIGLLITGYTSDMGCWTAWSQAAAGSGLFEIYADASFIDYPPGYVYILHVIGTIGKLAGIECYTDGYNLLLKIPSIIADLAMAWIFYKLGSKKINIKAGLVLALLYVMNPLTVLDSAAWGQIDAILTLAVAGYLIALYKRNIIGATLFFITGLLIKPQMLFFGPVLAVVFILYIKEKGWLKGLKVFIISLISGAGLFAAAVLPFGADKEWYWIFEKYLATIGSYNYITLNSANIYGLAGFNWMPAETVKWGMPLAVWGIIGLAVAVVIYFVLAFMNKNKSNIFMLSAMLMTGLYTFGLKMHERYLFPVIAVMLLAYIYDNREGIPAIFGILSTAVFVNVAQVLIVTHIPPENLLFRITSGIITAVYIGLVVFCAYSVRKSRTTENTEPIEDTETNEMQMTDGITS